MAPIFTRQALESRKKANREEAASIREKSKDLRAERDKLQVQIAPLEAKLREYNAKIRDIEDPLFELEQEHANLIRALPAAQEAPKEAEEDEAEEGRTPQVEPSE